VDTFQVLVFASLLIMAAISAISLAWAFYLDGKLRNRPSPKNFEVHIEGTKIFSDEDMAAAGEEARAGLHQVVVKSSEMLQASLAATISGLNKKTEEMATITLSQEFEKYQASFAALREETIKEFNDLQKQLEQRRADLTVELEDLVAKDREERVDAFNARIGDVVSSYLVEALDKGVDLGAQSKYIIHTLEAHKDDIKKDILA
jgi:hypothetical protein